MQSRELVKLYYRIGEVSEIVGVQPHVLRYWETEFRSIRPQKSSKGQRVYSRRDVEKLLRVKDLLRNQGFTIAGARKRLNESVASAPLLPRSHPEPVSAPSAESELTVAKNAPTPTPTSVEFRGGEQQTLPAQRAAGEAQPVGVQASEVAGLEARVARVYVDAEGAAPKGDWVAVGRRPASERGAKDMRKALLALRQDLLGMLDELSALRRP